MNRKIAGTALAGILVIAVLIMIGLDSRRSKAPVEAVSVSVEQQETPTFQVSRIDMDEFLESDGDDSEESADSESLELPETLSGKGQVIHSGDYSFQIPEPSPGGDPSIIPLSIDGLKEGKNTQVIGGAEVEDGVFLYNSLTTEVTKLEEGKVALTISSQRFKVDVSGGVEELTESDAGRTIEGNPENMVVIASDETIVGEDGETTLLGGVIKVISTFEEEEISADDLPED